MPRKPRNRSVEAKFPHHVVLRGNNRRRIFSYPYERVLFLKLLKESTVKFSCDIHALCLLTNHIHLIITPQEAFNLSRCLQSVCQRYAQRRNKARCGSGKLFEQRFFSEKIDSEEYLAIATVYVDLNHANATGATDPSHYPWSSYAIHVGKGEGSRIPPALWTPSFWYTGLGGDARTRVEQYQSLAQWYYARRTELKRYAWLEQQLLEEKTKHLDRFKRPNRRSAL